MTERNQTCENCCYFYEDEETIALASGNCRRHAPVHNQFTSMNVTLYRTEWPVVSPDDWCGDWEPRPVPVEYKGADENNEPVFVQYAAGDWPNNPNKCEHPDEAIMIYTSSSSEWEYCSLCGKILK